MTPEGKKTRVSGASSSRSRPKVVARTGKTVWPPGNMAAPAPAALVSCREPGGKANLITVGWCGNINTNPPMLSISLRPERFSFGIIERTDEFVVNFPSVSIARAVDYCGVVSGRDVDKFATAGLTEAKAGGVDCPLVAECPINISCRATERVPLGSHVLILAKVLEVAVDSALVDGKGAFRIDRADLLCYAHGFYFGLSGAIGHFGWSVRKKKKHRPGRKQG